jgi:hypothetical protein
MQPICIFFTKSFWLAIATLALLLDQGQTVIDAAVYIFICFWSWIDAIIPLPGLTEATLASFIRKAGPVITFLAALQQRSGAARPYSLSLKAA